MKTVKLIIFLVIFSAAVFAQPDFYLKSMMNYRKAVSSLENGYKDSLLYFIKQANIYRENHPGLIYARASAYCLNGFTDSSMNDLQLLSEMGLYFTPQKDSDFVKLWKYRRFKNIVSSFEKNNDPFGNGTPLFELDKNDRIIEGITFDKRSKSYYLSNVTRGGLVLLDSSMIISEFPLPDSINYFSLLGLTADSNNNCLWIAASALKQSVNAASGKTGISALVKFELETKTFEVVFNTSGSGENHSFNDICIGDSGFVYITDSRSNSIYRFDPNVNDYEIFINPGIFVSLQGIAFDYEKNQIFTADYSLGISRINIKTKSVTFLNPPAKNTLLGIDGLYITGNNLVAVQNGVKPNKVMKITLNNDHSSIDSVTIVNSNLPFYDEPTLGFIRDGNFIYIANSQWNKFEGSAPKDSTQNTVVISTGL